MSEPRDPPPVGMTDAELDEWLEESRDRYAFSNGWMARARRLITALREERRKWRSACELADRRTDERDAARAEVGRLKDELSAVLRQD